VEKMAICQENVQAKTKKDQWEEVEEEATMEGKALRKNMTMEETMGINGKVKILEAPGMAVIKVQILLLKIGAILMRLQRNHQVDGVKMTRQCKNKHLSQGGWGSKTPQRADNTFNGSGWGNTNDGGGWNNNDDNEKKSSPARSQRSQDDNNRGRGRGRGRGGDSNMRGGGGGGGSGRACSNVGKKAIWQENARTLIQGLTEEVEAVEVERTASNVAKMVILPENVPILIQEEVVVTEDEAEEEVGITMVLSLATNVKKKVTSPENALTTKATMMMELEDLTRDKEEMMEDQLEETMLTVLGTLERKMNSLDGIIQMHGAIKANLKKISLQEIAMKTCGGTQIQIKGNGDRLSMLHYCCHFKN